MPAHTQGLLCLRTLKAYACALTLAPSSWRVLCFQGLVPGTTITTKSLREHISYKTYVAHVVRRMEGGRYSWREL